MDFICGLMEEWLVKVVEEFKVIEVLGMIKIRNDFDCMVVVGIICMFDDVK